MGTHIKPHELLQTPYIEQLEQKASRELTPDEYQLVLESINFHTAKRNRKAIVIIGGAGSGKSYLRDNSDKFLLGLDETYNMSDFMKIDNECFRRAHSDYLAYEDALKRVNGPN